MMLNVSIETKDEIEKFLLIINMGITIAMNKGLINIEDAEKYLYNPHSINKIKTLGIRNELIQLFELGCELEDIESLVPDKLNNAINDLYNKSIELFKNSTSTSNKKWID